MYPIQDIKAAYPIDAYLRKAGIPVTDHTGKPTCCCPFHQDTHPSMTIRLDKQDWKCWVCDIGGSVIDLHMRLKGFQKVKDAIKDLAEGAGIPDDHQGRKYVADTYDYRDASGKLMMKVDRIEQGLDKRFAQYVETEDGKRVDTVKDVKKVLFRYERWADKDEVALCEGEKCVKALETLSIDATTNAGGSSAWLPAYSEYLRDKHVNIWPDSDSAGDKWITAVIESLKNKVASLRVLRVPKPYNDVADVLLLQGSEIGEATIHKIMADTRRMPKGLDIPVLSSADLYSLYVKRVTAPDGIGVDLSKWLPSFRAVRPLLPGDLAVLLSDTGVGKTTILTNVAFSQSPAPVLFFELELTAEDMCERFMSLSHQRAGRHIEADVASGKRHDAAQWGNVYTCPQSKVSIDDMEDIINKAELVIGKRPKLVLIDYIGLISGKDNKRYERMSNIAEGLKVLAKNTETVVMLSSQIHRDKERKDISLHDAKDSGSIEASAQLVIGAWRPQQDRINLKLLKCTKSSIGLTIECSFNGDTQTIKEVGR